MCTLSCLRFGESQLSRDEVTGKRVLEVGALNVNGSLREHITHLKPLNYLGVDIVPGPGVDEICDINHLLNRYGKESFDLVICTETLEHVRDWRKAVSNLKNILTPHGVLLLTTRSKEFAYHGYPFDFWRYGVDDMTVIFGDLAIESNVKDPAAPGVFLKARKPIHFVEKNMGNYDVYSIIRHKHCKDIGNFSIRLFKVKTFARVCLSRILPKAVKSAVKNAVGSES